MYATAPSFRTVATAFAGATVYTALLLAVSTSPARAATTDTQFIQKVEAQIANPNSFAPTGRGVATVAVRVDASGKLLSAALVGSTGDKALDANAVATTRSLDWPAGRARTVGVVLSYGGAKVPAKAASVSRVNRYTNAKGEALAEATPAPNAG
jgi:TonB family protein